MRRLVALAFALACPLAGLVPAGCGESSPELFTVQFDAGNETDARPDAEPEVDPTLGGPCTEDAQCEDTIPCTYDRCDQALSRCRNTPDDSLCSDDVYCNGREICVLRRGCTAGPVITCQDDNGCTIDKCIEATKSCERKPRDSDGDGDPDNHCPGHNDCDDIDPTVNSLSSEICGNFKDDNCNGQIDEAGCLSPANDVCATALGITAPGTFFLSSFATKKDYATSCSVKNPAAGRDVVVEITVPAGGPAKNVIVRAQTYTPDNEVAIALQSTCGSAPSEIMCGHTQGAPDARAIARNVAPGTSVYAVVTSQVESSVDLQVDFADAGNAPTNEACATPQPVAIDAPFTARLIDATKDLATSCDGAQTGELTYSFTLTAAADVRIFASTLPGTGTGAPVVTIRDGTCSGELRCRVGLTPPVFARNLQPGTHVFTVAGTTQLDANVLVKTYPVTPAPPNQSCATAPLIAANVEVPIDLSGQEDAIPSGCLPGTPTAAYRLDLAVPSDVLIVGRFSLNEIGAVAIHGPISGPGGCTTSDLLVCSQGQTPVRASRRNLAAGSYRVIVADELGQTANVMALVRPTIAPTLVNGSDGCVSPLVLPQTGGFFTGDTTGAMADFNASCDSPGLALGGAPDRMLRFDLAQPQRVVFDMSGSFLTTLLNIRSGAACPGLENPGMCFVGFGEARSFLDVQLPSGTHWVQLDGYAGAAGAFNLDVRVLPP